MTHLIPQHAWAFLQREPDGAVHRCPRVADAWRVGHPLAVRAGLAWEHM